MSLNEKIAEDYIAAYKGKDSLRLNVLRLVKTAIKNRLVELSRPHDVLGDEEIIEIIQRQCKQRKDSIEQYTSAGREELANRESEELQVLREYLPPMLEGEDLEKVINNAIGIVNAKKPADMGKVMKFVMNEFKGQVDGKILSERVRQKLTEK